MVTSTAGLGGAASRGAAVTLVGQLIRVVIQFGGIFVLARLLSPNDYGLLAMVVAIVGIGEVIRDFGLSSAAIQSKSLDHAQKSNLFWINGGIGVGLSLCALALAVPISAFYGQPDLVGLTQLLAVSFTINGLATQFRAQLNRSLDFLRLSLADILGQAVGLGVAIALALMGFGYWALGWQQVVQGIVMLAVVTVAARWRPGRYTRGAGIRPLLSFGGNMMGAQLLGYTSRNIDSVIIGATVGAAPLGIYNRAFQLLMLPLNQLNAPATRVALPVLSRLQDDKASFDTFVIRGQSILIHAIVALFAFAASQALPLMTLILGSQWTAAAPIFQILCIAGAAQACSYATYWIFLAKGLTRSNLYYALCTRPLLIGLILLGSVWGLFGIAWAYSLGLLLMWPLGLYWISRVSNAPAREMFINGVRVVCIYVLCGAASYLSTYFIDLPDPAEIGIGLVAFSGALGLVVLISRRVRSDVRGMRHSVSLLRSRNR